MLCVAVPCIPSFKKLMDIGSWEWTVVGLACDCYSFIVVPIYGSMGEVAVHHIVEQTEVSVRYCSLHLLSYL